jgi:hypothetical protein
MVVGIEFVIWRLTGAGKLVLNWKIVMTRQEYSF